MWTLADHEVRRAAADVLTGWVSSQGLLLHALLLGAHFHLRTDAPVDWVQAVGAIVFGSVRMEMVQPGLLERQVTSRGHSSPTLAAGIDSLFRCFTEPCRHEPVPDDARHAPAPPLVDERA